MSAPNSIDYADFLQICEKIAFFMIPFIIANQQEISGVLLSHGVSASSVALAGGIVAYVAKRYVSGDPVPESPVPEPVSTIVVTEPTHAG